MADKKPNYTSTIVTGNIDGEQKMIAEYNKALENAPFLFKSFASNAYQDIYSPNLSVQDGFDRFDYDHFRPEERIPRDDKGKIIACMAAYEESGNGLIANIVDLIADLVVQGIDVVHKKKKNEKFAKVWFNRTVRGPDLSERFTNMLCRAGNVIIKRDSQKIPLSITRKYYQGTSSIGVTPTIEKREIPTSYTILDVRAIDVFSAELALFVDSDNIQFGLTVPPDVIRKITLPVTPQDKDLVSSIPADIVIAIRNGTRLIPLDRSKVSAYYYKKDHWKVWATPMIYRVLSDVQTLKKMKLADLSCLDGVLSQLRVWKLGSIDGKARPSQGAFNRLASILSNRTAGGVMDVIWGPDIELVETSSQTHHFLGEPKYIPILNAIYSGLGIPPLFSGATNQGSFTSNFLAIKTFIVRLEYLRDKLKEFWENEFKILAKALNWDEPPTLVFDRMTLNDESSILQVMLHLVDRNILSDEAMLEMVGAIPEIEKIRTQREWKSKENGKRPPKASTFHRPDFMHTWIERFIQGGDITPSQVGIELEPKKPGEKTPNETQVDLGIIGPDSKSIPSDFGGRPKGKKDSKKRKQKTVKPQRGVNSYIRLAAWALDMQDKVNEELTPIYLDMLEKKNLRQLTVQETEDFEQLKFGLLANMTPYFELNKDSIHSLLKTHNTVVPELMQMLISEMIVEQEKEAGGNLNIHQVRRLQSLAYAAYRFDEGVILEE